MRDVEPNEKQKHSVALQSTMYVLFSTVRQYAHSIIRSTNTLESNAYIIHE